MEKFRVLKDQEMESLKQVQVDTQTRKEVERLKDLVSST